MCVHVFVRWRRISSGRSLNDQKWPGKRSFHVCIYMVLLNPTDACRGSGEQLKGLKKMQKQAEGRAALTSQQMLVEVPGNSQKA